MVLLRLTNSKHCKRAALSLLLPTDLSLFGNLLYLTTLFLLALQPPILRHLLLFESPHRRLLGLPPGKFRVRILFSRTLRINGFY
jgi:hypothetical protein